MANTEGMFKARVEGARINQMCKCQLSNSSKALEDGTTDNIGLGSVNVYETENRISYVS